MMKWYKFVCLIAPLFISVIIGYAGLPYIKQGLKFDEAFQALFFDIGGIDVSKNIKLKIAQCDSITIELNNRVFVDAVMNIWLHDCFLYGWYYEGEGEDRSYRMFLINIDTLDCLKGENAKKSVLDLRLPIDCWTSGTEVFGRMVTDVMRRERFFKALKDYCEDRN